MYARPPKAESCFEWPLESRDHLWIELANSFVVVAFAHLHRDNGPRFRVRPLAAAFGFRWDSVCRPNYAALKRRDSNSSDSGPLMLLNYYCLRRLVRVRRLVWRRVWTVPGYPASIFAIQRLSIDVVRYDSRTIQPIRSKRWPRSLVLM